MLEYEQRLEAAARKLCSIRGVDPESRESFSIPGDHSMVARRRERWKNVARELELVIENIKIKQLITEFDLL